MRNAPIMAVLALATLAACNRNPIDPMAATIPTPAATLPSTTTQDQNFAMQAAGSDMFEIQSSQLALQKSRNPAIRRFAQQMVEAHTATTKRLTVLASQKGASLPQMMPPPEQEMIASLQSARGASFDRQYAAMQVKAHTAAVEVFRTEAQDGHDTDLRGFAQQVLPDIQGHLTMAQRLRG